MTKSTKRSSFLVALILFAAVCPRQIEAQRRAAKHHAVVLAAASLDEQFKDVSYLLHAAGVPEFDLMISTIVKNEFEKGLDVTKPLGGYVDVPAKPDDWVWFAPVTDFDGLLNMFGGARQTEDVGNGVVKMTPAGITQFAKVEGGYAYFSDNIQKLVALPMVPEAELGGLDKTYNVAVQFNMQLLPDDHKKQLVDSLKTGFVEAVTEVGNIHDAAGQLAKQFSDAVLGTATRLVTETDLILLGFAVDREAKNIYLDVDITGLKDSQLARQLGRLWDAKSRFAGFVTDDALFNFNFVETIPQSDVELYKLTLSAIRAQVLKGMQENGSLNEDQQAAVTDLTETVFDTLARTAESGQFDAGGAIMLTQQSKLTVATGVAVADPDVLEKQFQTTIQRLLKEANIPAGKFKAVAYKNVRMHTLKMPLPEDDDVLRKLFGEQTDLVVGFSDDAVYLAIGDAGMATLQRAIDRSAPLADKVVPAVNIQLSIGSLIKLAAVADNKPEMVKLVDRALAAGLSDKFTLTSKSIPRGMTARIQVDEGVIRIIGQASRQVIMHPIGPDGF